MGTCCSSCHEPKEAEHAEQPTLESNSNAPAVPLFNQNDSAASTERKRSAASVKEGFSPLSPRDHWDGKNISAFDAAPPCEVPAHSPVQVASRRLRKRPSCDSAVERFDEPVGFGQS